MPAPSHNDRLSRRALWALLAAFLFIWCVNLGHPRLIRTDEGRYAEIAREMVASGDWVTPRQNGYPYFEKPPLQYWATAAAFTVFGAHEWTARLWTALCGLCGIAISALAARRIWGNQTALTSAIVLGGTLQWAAMGHFASLDMSLAAFLSGAIAAFCAAQCPPDTSANERASDAVLLAPIPSDRRWMLTAWLLLALAVLSKGVVALALPAASAFVYMVWQRDWGLLRRSRLPSGLLVLLAVCAPWFVLVSARNPGFAHFFFIQEHLERFLTPMHGRDAPLWFFVPVLIAGLLPWTLLLPAACRTAFAARSAAAPGSALRSGGFDASAFLALWALVCFVFFSVSHSKLESYLLPIYPALALLIARALPEFTTRSLVWTHRSILLLGVALLIAVPVAIRRGSAHIPPELLAAYEPWLLAAAAAMIIGAFAGLHLVRSARRQLATLSLAGACLLATQLALSGHESLAPIYSSYDIARVMRPLIHADTALYMVDTYDHTLPFYTGHTYIMVGYKDELAVPIDREPGPFIKDVASFEPIWRNSAAALAVMTHQQYQRFVDAGLPMKKVAQDPRRIVVATPTTPL